MKARFLYRAFKARYRNERMEIRTALSVLKSGEVAVDVGANKGAYLYWLRRAVGVEGRVFAYEPQHGLANYLHSVCAAMRWSNVFVRECALSESAGIGRLHVPDRDDSPAATLERPATGTGASHSCACEIDTLDHQLQTTDRVAFLKVDVEGHELNVFRGGVETLTRHRPIILFECEARHLTRHSMQDVFGFLESFGYYGSFFCQGSLRPLSEFDPKLHQRRDSERFWDEPDYCNNFLFQPGTQGRFSM